jgi:hypothetical protein
LPLENGAIPRSLNNNFKIMEEALGNDQIRTIPEEEAGVVVLNGEAYMNVSGRYVLEAEAKVIFQERKVRKETDILRKMEEDLYKKAEDLKKVEDAKTPEKVKEVITKEK